MPIIKFANGKNCGTDALKNGIKYILNPQKTSHDLIYGNGIDLDSPYEDMHTVQTLLRKNTGRRYIHYIISFDTGVSAKTAYKVSTKCANYFSEDYQYVLAVHTNTPNIHAHIIMNAVNIRTGKKFSQSKVELFKFRDYINQCLVQNGLNPISANTSNKLVHEEVFEDDEFEFNYEPTVIVTNRISKFSHTFSEVEQLHAFGCNSSFFGPVDYMEAKQIQAAEAYHSQQQDIIHFFQGDSSVLPTGINIVDAELIYEQWLEGQQCLKEDEDNGFFSKNPRCNDC